ncbi:hypothetical protein A7P53_11015 [Acinetobacter defluvii]|uniref:hypothetical protein n=1 Tax=Acinetobacter defluvii TaxID=1871111 RepID=UPI00149024EA|nr:hypothetical protein [Acinetobacter defluvii]NNP73097.1 hypothetical protein [Acinetobacter defluvii]
MKNKESLTTITDVGIEVLSDGTPIISPIYKLFQAGQQAFIQNRINGFIKAASIEQSTLEKIIHDEDYTNILFLSLDVVSRTTCKIAIASLALIYKNYNEDTAIIKRALRAFKEIDDITLSVFEKIYESYTDTEEALHFTEQRDEGLYFINEYDEVLDLINRGFFSQVASSQNLVTKFRPLSAIKNPSTDLFYQAIKEAKALI